MKKSLIFMWDPTRSWKPADYQEFVNNHNQTWPYDEDFDDDDIDIEDDDEDDDDAEWQDYDTLNWSVNEYKKLKDRAYCYLMKIGDDHPGLMVSGITTCNPYRGEDWSGQGRKTYYVDFDVHHMSNYDSPLIPLDVLEREIPDFNWRGGHSGRFLTETQSVKLHRLWLEMFYKTNPDNCFSGFRLINAPYDELLMADGSHNACACCGYDYQKLNPHSGLHHSLYLLWPSKEVREKDCDDVYKHIHAVCENCYELNEGYVRKMAGENYVSKVNGKKSSYYYSDTLKLYLRVDSDMNFFTKADGEYENGPIAVEAKCYYGRHPYIRNNNYKKITKTEYNDCSLSK